MIPSQNGSSFSNVWNVRCSSVLFWFNIPHDPSRVLRGRDARSFLIFLKSKYSQLRGFSESKPVPCTNRFRKKRLSILASCMANLSKFHVVFSSSTLIRFDKDAFEGHLCQTVKYSYRSPSKAIVCGLNKLL